MIAPRAAACLAAAFLLAACAGGPPPAPPRIERLSAEALAARLPQPTATVGLDEIVAMSRAGRGADQIVARLKESHSRHRLSAHQVLDLAGRGVPAAVLDHLVESERTATFDDMAAELARRDQTCRDSLEQELRQCRLQCLASPCQPFPFSTCWPPRPGYPNWHCF